MLSTSRRTPREAPSCIGRHRETLNGIERRGGHAIEIHQARAFVVVAEELHFGRAAVRLGMAQPPLSRIIRQLESNLGVALFQRTTRSVSLTAAGSALVEPARHLLATQQAAIDSVRSATRGEVGRIRFGYSHPSSSALAAALVAASVRRSPGITFAIESRVYAGEGMQRIMDGSLDLALVRWRQRPPLVAGRPVQRERPCIALPADHRLAGRDSLGVAELRDEDFVFLPPSPNSSLRETGMRLCLNAGFSPTIVQIAPDSQSIAALVSAGLGISITFDSVAAGYRDPAIVSVPIADTGEETTLYLAHRHDHENAALLSVLDLAEQVLPTVR